MGNKCRMSWLLVLSLIGNAWASPIGCSAENEDNRLPAGAVARLGNQLFRHEGYVCSLAFSPDGKRLAAAAGDGNVYLWQARTGKRIRRFAVAPFNHCYPSIAFSPDGKRLAVRTDGELSFWDTATAKKLFCHHLGTYVNLFALDALRIRFSPDGKKVYLAVESGKKSGVAVVNAAVDAKVRYLGMAKDSIYTLALSEDGKTLALALDDEAIPGDQTIIRLLDTTSGEIIREFRPAKSSFTVFSVALTPDGKKVAWIDGERNILLGDLKTGKQIAVPGMDGTQLAFAAAGKTLIVNGPGDKVCFWDMTRQRRTRELDRRHNNWRCLALSADGRVLAAAGGDRVVEVWDLNARPEKPAAILGHDTAVVAVAFSPDGKRLLSGDAEKEVRLWDATKGRPLQTWQTSGGLLTFSQDGKRFASTRGDRRVRYGEDADPVAHVWDIATGKELFQLRHEASYAVAAIAFSSDDRFLVTAAARVDGGLRPPRQTSLHVWDRSTARCLGDRFLYRGEIASGAVLSADGRTLAFGGEEGERSPVWIASTLKRRQPFILPGSKNWLPLALSADGKLLATRTWKHPQATKEGDKAIYLWETATGKEVLPKPLDGRLFLIFSPDGRLAAASTDDWASSREAKPEPFSNIRIYDLASGREVHRFRADGSDVASLAFSPDGCRLASGLSDGTVLLWELSALRAALRAKGELAAEEMARRWTELGDEDARKAYRAIWTLSDHPQQAIPFLRERLASTGSVDVSRMRRLITDLDSNEFVIREHALAELEKFSDAAEPGLRAALRQKPSLETRRRIEQVLDKLDGKPLTPPRLRALRAVTILERIGDASARQVLSKLAAGQEDVRLTQEAKAALQRLRRR